MPIVPIIVGVMFLVGIVGLAMSGSTWRWYHITIASLTLIFSLVWFYLAARVLKIENTWRSEIAQYEKQIHEQEARHKKAIEGDPSAEGDEQLSYAELKTKVEKLQQGRGRMWANAQRRGVTPDGVITATVADSTGLEKNSVLYVFDYDNPKAPGPVLGQFLGQFEVTDLKGLDVTLTPSLKLRASELQRIAQRRGGPLVMYEIMPADTQDIDSKELLAKFPKTVPPDARTEFEKDGKPPAADEQQADHVWQRVKALKNFEITIGQGNAKETQMVSEGAVLLLDPKSAQEHIKAGDVAAEKDESGNDKVYVRPLRDFAQLYRDLNLQIESTLRSIAEIDRQQKIVSDAQKKVDADLAYRLQEKTRSKPIKSIIWPNRT